jgi:uncharacterized OB-fold protein
VEDSTLDDRLAALVGQPISGRGRTIAPDPVNQPMIRHWAAAFEDWNPVYTDPDAAARSRFGEIVAPPLMLQTWMMATPKITGIAERGGSPVEGGGATALGLLDDAGFVGTLATNSEFEIVRYLRLGETVESETVMDAISPEKQTRLGPGRFVTWVTSYFVGDEVVGRQRFRILKFKPGGRSHMSERLAPSTSLDTQFFWDALREHRLLIQRCSSCGALRHPPRPMCPACNSLDWDTLEASGRGTVFSFVMPRHPQFPWFDDPYIVAIVELEEGTRIVTNLVDVAPGDVTIGMPVEVRFETFEGGLVLPLFTPAEGP